MTLATSPTNEKFRRNVNIGSASGDTRLKKEETAASEKEKTERGFKECVCVCLCVCVCGGGGSNFVVCAYIDGLN